MNEQGTDKTQGTELTPEELEQVEGEPLPERVQMSLIGAIQGWHMTLPVPPVDES